MTKFSETCIRVKQKRHQFYLTSMPAKVLTAVSYAAVRRVDEEEGAIQRLLDQKRIADLKRFVLSGGDYPSAVVLNWVSTENPISIEGDKMSFAVAERLAQLVDGQHRVEGLREAIAEQSEVGKVEIPVAVYQGLTTAECATIFLSINDKQKPVPRSLVVDLYGIQGVEVGDPVTERARDLAEILNSEEDSPYHSLIRFANEPRSKFGIAVSTVVDRIKPLVEPQGLLAQVGITELNMQKNCLFNFFQVLKNWYGKRWDEKSNVFLSSAGFSGAMDFLTLVMIPHCNLTGDYSTDHIAKSLRLDPNNLISREELKGKQGRASWTAVQEQLKNRFTPGTKKASDLKF